jgi:DNA-binding IclR family transcriptional regulator
MTDRAEGAEALSQTRLTRSVTHALDVLWSFSPESPSWGVNDLGRHLGLHKSTVSRLLATLEERRLVRRDPATDKYSLGIGIVELAGVLLDELDLRRVAAPHLRQLSAATRETVNLAIWDGKEVVLVEHLPSPEPVKYLGWIGHREPAHCVSPGKAMLAFAGPETVQAVIDAGLTAYTPRTLAQPEELLRDLEATRRRGYAINQGEFRESLNGVAAPIWQFPGALTGAVAVAGPAYRLSPERLARFGEMVKQTAIEISRALGAPMPLLERGCEQRHSPNAPLRA